MPDIDTSPAALRALADDKNPWSDGPIWPFKWLPVIRDVLRAIADEKEKAEAERDAARWQPIETAPKDGTLVDLWAGERIADCAWNVPSNCWAERSVSSFSGRPYWAVVNNPTHWMPLPAAPTNPEDAPHA